MDQSGTSRTPSPSSTCPSPATSLGNLSLTDSGWSSASDWSLRPSAPSSRSCSPSLVYPTPSESSLPPSIADYKPIIRLALESAKKSFPIPSSFTIPDKLNPLTWDDTADTGDSLAAPSEVGPSRRKKRIPRPPNAFMLFRAKVVNAQLPYDLENRQQMVSIIAGHAWNLLKPYEKDDWKKLAKSIQAEHMEKYPDYKFSPSRKSARKDQGLGVGSSQPSGETTEEFQRRLREKYLKIVGPSVASPRTRKPKKGRKVDSNSKKNRGITLPSLLPSGPSPQPIGQSQGTFFGLSEGVLPVSLSSTQYAMTAGMLPPISTYSALDWSTLVPQFTNDTLLSVPSPTDSLPGSEVPSITDDLLDSMDWDKTPTAATFGQIPPLYYTQPTMYDTYSNPYLLGLDDLSPEYSALSTGMLPLQQSMVSPASTFPLQAPGDRRLWAHCLDFSGMEMPPSQFGLGGMHLGPESQVSLPPSGIPEEVQETCGVKPSQLL